MVRLIEVVATSSLTVFDTELCDPGNYARHNIRWPEVPVDLSRQQRKTIYINVRGFVRTPSAVM